MTIPSGLGLRKIKKGSSPGKSSSPPAALKRRLKSGEHSTSSSVDRGSGSSTPLANVGEAAVASSGTVILNGGQPGPLTEAPSSSSRSQEPSAQQHHHAHPHHHQRSISSRSEMSIKDRLSLIARERRLEENRRIFGCNAIPVFINCPASSLRYHLERTRADQDEASMSQHEDEQQPLRENKEDSFASVNKPEQEALDAASSNSGLQRGNDNAATPRIVEHPSSELPSRTQSSVEHAFLSPTATLHGDPAFSTGIGKRRKESSTSRKHGKRKAQTSRSVDGDVRSSTAPNDAPSEVVITSSNDENRGPSRASNRIDGRSSPYLAPPQLDRRGRQASPRSPSEAGGRTSSRSEGEDRNDTLRRRFGKTASRDSARSSNPSRAPSRASSGMTTLSNASSEAVEMEAMQFHPFGWREAEPSPSMTLAAATASNLAVIEAIQQASPSPSQPLIAPMPLPAPSDPSQVQPQPLSNDVNRVDAVTHRAMSLHAGPPAQFAPRPTISLLPNGEVPGIPSPPRAPRMHIYANGHGGGYGQAQIHHRRTNHWDAPRPDPRQWHRQPSPLGSRSSDLDFTSNDARNRSDDATLDKDKDRVSAIPGASLSQAATIGIKASSSKKCRQERTKAATKVREAKARQEEQSRRIAEAVAAAERGDKIGPTSTSTQPPPSPFPPLAPQHSSSDRSAGISSVGRSFSAADSPVFAPGQATEDSGGSHHSIDSSLVTAGSTSPLSRQASDCKRWSRRLSRTDTEASFHTAMHSQSSSSLPIAPSPGQEGVRDHFTSSQDEASDGMTMLDHAVDQSSRSWGPTSTSDAGVTTDPDATICSPPPRVIGSTASFDDAGSTAKEELPMHDSEATLLLPNVRLPRNQSPYLSTVRNEGRKDKSPRPSSRSPQRPPSSASHNSRSSKGKKESKRGAAPLSALPADASNTVSGQHQEGGPMQLFHSRGAAHTAPWLLRRESQLRDDSAAALRAMESTKHGQYRYRDIKDEAARLERTREWSSQLKTMTAPAPAQARVAQAQTSSGQAAYLAPSPLVALSPSDATYGSSAMALPSPHSPQAPPPGLAAPARKDVQHAAPMPASPSQPDPLAHRIVAPHWLQAGSSDQGYTTDAESAWLVAQPDRWLGTKIAHPHLIFSAQVSQMPAFEETHQRRSRAREYRLAKLAWCDLEGFVETRRWVQLRDGSYKVHRSWRTHSVLAPGHRLNSIRYPCEDLERTAHRCKEIYEIWRREVQGAARDHEDSMARRRGRGDRDTPTSRRPRRVTSAERSPDTSRTEDTSSGSVEITTVLGTGSRSNVGHGPAFTNTETVQPHRETSAPTVEPHVKRFAWLDQLEAMQREEKDGIKHFINYSSAAWEQNAGGWLPNSGEEDEASTTLAPSHMEASSSPEAPARVATAPSFFPMQPCTTFIDLCYRPLVPFAPLSDAVTSRMSLSGESTEGSAEGSGTGTPMTGSPEIRYQQPLSIPRSPPRAPAKDRLSASAAIFSQSKTSSSGSGRRSNGTTSHHQQQQQQQRQQLQDFDPASLPAGPVLLPVRDRLLGGSRSAVSTPGPHTSNSRSYGSHHYRRSHAAAPPQQVQGRRGAPFPQPAKDEEEHIEFLVDAVRSYIALGLQPGEEPHNSGVSEDTASLWDAPAPRRTDTASARSPGRLPPGAAYHPDIPKLAEGVQQKLARDKHQHQNRQLEQAHGRQAEPLPLERQPSAESPRTRTPSLRQQQLELESMYALQQRRRQSHHYRHSQSDDTDAASNHDHVSRRGSADGIHPPPWLEPTPPRHQDGYVRQEQQKVYTSGGAGSHQHTSFWSRRGADSGQRGARAMPSDMSVSFSTPRPTAMSPTTRYGPPTLDGDPFDDPAILAATYRSVDARSMPGGPAGGPSGSPKPVLLGPQPWVRRHSDASPLPAHDAAVAMTPQPMLMPHLPVLAGTTARSELHVPSDYGQHNASTSSSRATTPSASTSTPSPIAAVSEPMPRTGQAQLPTRTAAGDGMLMVAMTSVPSSARARLSMQQQQQQPMTMPSVSPPMQHAGGPYQAVLPPSQLRQQHHQQQYQQHQLQRRERPRYVIQAGGQQHHQDWSTSSVPTTPHVEADATPFLPWVPRRGSHEAALGQHHYVQQQQPQAQGQVRESSTSGLLNVPTGTVPAPATSLEPGIMRQRASMSTFAPPTQTMMGIVTGAALPRTPQSNSLVHLQRHEGGSAMAAAIAAPSPQPATAYVQEGRPQAPPPPPPTTARPPPPPGIAASSPHQGMAPPPARFVHAPSSSKSVATVSASSMGMPPSSPPVMAPALAPSAS